MRRSIGFAVALSMAASLCACATSGHTEDPHGSEHEEIADAGAQVNILPQEETVFDEPIVGDVSIESLRAALDLTGDLRSSFVHGAKGSEYQKYIVLHDTEGEGSAASVIDWWDSNGNLIAAHFVINKDGSMVQCAPLDAITHHAGFGDTGHNAFYGVEDESRDDKLGAKPIGSWASDYGMNSYSIGIELVHVGGSGDYPEAQLEALDALIAYIDAYYGFESTIIDHKAWRTGNSDTSREFAPYLASYQVARTHAGL